MDKLHGTKILQDELTWAAAWLYKATNNQSYWDYILNQTNNLPQYVKSINTDGTQAYGGSFAEFGWDTKYAGINILVSKVTKHIEQCLSSSQKTLPHTNLFLASCSW